VTLRYRELEHTRLYAGLGVRLVDDYTQQAPIGWTRVSLDIADDDAWRELDTDLAPRTVTAGGLVWFPWLERRRDSRARASGRYRLRVAAELATPAYLCDRDGIEVLVAPFDDASPPAGTPPIIEIALLPAANYPYAPGVPVLHGVVKDAAGEPVPRALVSWARSGDGPPHVTDEVLSDDDGEFSLPMRRAPLATPIDITARRRPPPVPGPERTVQVKLPADLSTLLTIQFL
jgi:hypothetical protein